MQQCPVSSGGLRHQVRSLWQTTEPSLVGCGDRRQRLVVGPACLTATAVRIRPGVTRFVPGALSQPPFQGCAATQVVNRASAANCSVEHLVRGVGKLLTPRTIDLRRPR